MLETKAAAAEIAAQVFRPQRAALFHRGAALAAHFLATFGHRLDGLVTLAGCDSQKTGTTTEAAATARQVEEAVDRALTARIPGIVRASATARSRSLAARSWRSQSPCIDRSAAGMRASQVIANGYGWCVPKATLLAAACRAAGIPAQ